jgi:hypothetical protein
MTHTIKWDFIKDGGNGIKCDSPNVNKIWSTIGIVENKPTMYVHIKEKDSMKTIVVGSEPFTYDQVGVAIKAAEQYINERMNAPQAVL